VQDALFVKNPYAPRPFTLADLSAIDLDRSLALYRRRFSSARGFTFVLAGNFDPDAVKPLIAAYLGTLPTDELPLGYRDAGVGFARGVVERELQAGTEPKSTLVLGFSGDAVWSPEERLRFDAMLEVMQLRIDDVLREKLQLLYAGRISGAMYPVPGRNCYLIRTWLPTAPGNTGQLEAALMAEIERLKRDGPTPAELEKVKRTWRQEWARSEQGNFYWVELLRLSNSYGIDPQRFLRRGEQADALGAEDVREAARRYFDTGNHLRFVLNPETAAPAASPVAVLAPR
jgi:zinc protease